MKRFPLLLLCVAALFRLAAQPVARTDIPALGRLPVNAIHRIFQDSEGYMWYGTVNGLCRDDGYRVRVFRSDFNHRGVMADNLVECIAEDADGDIWFGTDKGAYRLDKRTCRIRQIDHPLLDGRMVYQIYTTRDGAMWVSVEGTLLKFRKDSAVKTYPTLNDGRPTHLSGFCEGRDGQVVLSFSDGRVYRWDGGRDELVAFPDRMKRHNPCTIVQDVEQDCYWLGTWGDGIVRFSPSAVPDSMFLYPSHLSDIPEENTVLYMAQQQDSRRLWVTTQVGLSAFDVHPDGLSVCPTGVDFPARRVMLNDLVFDRSGNLWVSAFDIPSFILNFSGESPRMYDLPLLHGKTHFRPAVMALQDDGSQVFWLFQERVGLFLYDVGAGRLAAHQDFPSTRGLPLQMVKIMAGSRAAHAVWVVPEFSVTAFRLSHENFRMSLSDRVDLSAYPAHHSITALHEGQDGKSLWIGTDRGVLHYDLRKKKVVRELATLGHVTEFAFSPRGELWMATRDKGLYVLGLDGRLRRYAFAQALSCLAAADNGLLWIGSDEGDLLSFDPSSGRMRSYNRVCHLNGDMVNSVATDEFGHVYVGTNQKIIELNPRNNSYRMYLTTDGSLGLWRVIPTAFCKGKDGAVYFGGLSGICRFTPSNVLDREATPARVAITDIVADDRSLFFDEGRAYAVDSVVDVAPAVQRVEICFSSLDHRLAHKTRYAYRLSGVDDDWQYTAEGQHAAVYGRLPVGEHVFEVKATDENGQWSRRLTQVTLYRRPAFYETWWAILAAVLVLMAAVGGGVVSYVRRQRRRNNELWADSAEMMRMRDFLHGTDRGALAEGGELNRLLLEKAVRLVEENLADPDFNVNRLAQGMNMSRSTLVRKLKAITGRTPLDFIRHIKMEHARRLLGEWGRSVSDVAAALGYSDRKYFTSCFKEEFGMTPSDYQKSQSPEA